MKKIIGMVLVVWACTGLTAWGQNTKVSSENNDNFSPKTADFMEQMSYSLGYDIFEHLSSQVDLDLDAFLEGIADARGHTPKLSDEQMQQMLMAYQRLARQKAVETGQKQLETNRSRGRIFLEGNKLKEGVITLSTGLQYKVIKEGNGPVPRSDDRVECHYRGTLIDGTEFDASYQRGRPAVFAVSEVIAGWTQALTRMPVGSKWELYIPADLAYGDQGAGQLIEPGHTLVFEIELLAIVE